MDERQKECLEHLRALARKRGGKLLSTDYVNSGTHVRVACEEGHEWDVIPASLQRGSWCGRCAGVAPLTLDALHAIAHANGGECLATTYTNLKEPVPWRCEKGHEWSAPARHMRSTGCYCPRCAGRKTPEDMHALAAKRGGKFLSTEVKGAHDKYFWGCELGHTFSATRASVDIQGSWCPVCRKAARGTLARMRRIARKRKGECLSKEYVSSTHKLHFRCEERHEFWMTPAAVLNHWCPECGLGIGRSRPTLTLEDLEETAIERGGKCLSDEYRGVRAYYEWECASHHRWEATGQVVRSGHWCHRCAHRIVGTIEGMRAYAVGLGGECLSAEYTGQRTMLQFRCRARHRFELMGAAVKTGVWCPRCARDAGRDGAMKPDVRGTKTKRLDATG